MAPYMTSDDANEGPSVAEMQFTIRQLVRAMGGYSRLDVPATDATGKVTDANYDYVQTMKFTTAATLFGLEILKRSATPRPSSVKSTSPELSLSSRPTGNTRAGFTRRARAFALRVARAPA